MPIVLMVVAAAGIGGTLAYASHQASVAHQGGGMGRFPGGARPSGFPTDWTPGQWPSGFPTDGYTPGQVPSGFPTDGNTPRQRPSDFPSGNYTPGQRPGGGQGGNFPGGRQPSQASMTLTPWEIGALAACGVVFVGGAVLLVLTLLGRRVGSR